MKDGRFSHLEFDNTEDNPPRHEGKVFQTGSSQPSAELFLRQAHEDACWGEHERALRLYTKCLQEDRGTIAAWVGQVQMLVQLDECREARMWADKALELFRNNGELLAAKAQACVRLKDNSAAYACSDASMQASGSSAFRWQVRGEALLANGEKTYDACFKRAVTEPKSSWFDRVLIAYVFLFYNKAAAALESAKEALDLEPASGYAWYTLGICHESLGSHSAAISSMKRCLDLKQDYRPALDAINRMAHQSLLQRVLRRLKGRP